jgi:alkanesulfonate monooxygenase SsuD/methylene tetrahydromethanopterin reductase-like flavin-dependent oxidoreductase (luciferase family)
VTSPRSGSRALKVGVQLPEVEREVRWTELLEMARVVEDAGFDSLWYGDHLLYRRPGDVARGPWEAWTVLAGLAAVTTRVEIGPLVACTAFHNPAILAKQADTLDEISGGRLILGLGAGWNEVEFRAFGIPYDARVARFEEAFTIIRTLLRDGSIDFQGRYHEARDCELIPRGPRPGGPPLMVGSIGERMLRITAPHVDAWNAWYVWFRNGPEGVGRLNESVDAACRAVGREPSTLERTVAVLVQLTGARGRQAGDKSDRSSEVEPLRGSPEQLAEALLGFADVGISHIQLVLDPITRESIEEFAPTLQYLRGS